MKIKTNEGKLDRILRIVGGLLLLALAGFGYAGSGVWLWVFAILGALLVVTGAIGFCSLYLLLKGNTNKKK